MARTATPVNRDALTKSINEAARQNCGNFTNMCKAASDLYNQKHKRKDDKDISFSVVGLRIKEWGIANPYGDGSRSPRASQEGGKARPAPATPVKAEPKPRQGRAAAPTKGESIVSVEGHYKELENMCPPKYRGLVKKVRSGSKAAAIKLHCLACVGFQRKEVRACTALRCAMWTIRPYQGKASPEERNDPNYDIESDENIEEDESDED